MTNKNGQVPGAQLVSVGICKLWWGTGHAFKEAQAAAANDGVGLAPINSYSGYRSLALQRDGIAHPAKYGVAKGIRQLPAGHQTHGLGTAVDVISGFAWLKEHGHEYGFARSIPGDTYHFQHDGKTATGTNPASVGKVTTLVPKGLDMFTITLKKTKRTYLVTARGVKEITGHEAQFAILPHTDFEDQSSLNYVIDTIKSLNS